MKEDFFKVGYSTYLERKKANKPLWTSIFIKKIKNHKIITTIVFSAILCGFMNILLIYRFMSILESL